MALPLLRRKSYFVMFVGLFLLTLLTACGSTTSSNTQTSSPPPSTQNQTRVSPATATEVAIARLITVIGQPKAKMLSGTTFEVDGMIKNGDSQRHDIYLHATLLDASGKTIATAIQNVDDVKGGTTVAYAIQGTTPQPVWANVQVTVQKVTENITGSSTD